MFSFHHCVSVLASREIFIPLAPPPPPPPSPCFVSMLYSWYNVPCLCTKGSRKYSWETYKNISYEFWGYHKNGRNVFTFCSDRLALSSIILKFLPQSLQSVLQRSGYCGVVYFARAVLRSLLCLLLSSIFKLSCLA